MSKSDDIKMADADADSDSDLTGRSFALLDQGQRERLGAVLRPLAWIDGWITATVIAPDDWDALDEADLDDPSVVEDAMAWIEHIWAEETAADPGNLTPTQTAEAAMLATDHYCHVANLLLDDPEAYRPYLEGFSDPREAASQWAAGFCGGLSLKHGTWEPLIQDEDAGPLLVAIFSLLREEDMPEELRRDSPLRDLPAEGLAQMRRSALETLPRLVLELYDHARGDLDLDDDGLDPDDDLDPDEADDLDRHAADWKPVETYVRAAPKVGRNDTCPCGSGKKYKRCCIDQA